MMTYNFVIIENKVQYEYLNIPTKEEFFEELWEWTYVDDLWEFIEYDKPNYEYLIYFIDNTFIDQTIFHKYKEDELDCFAFIVHDDGKVSVYNWNKSIKDFILKKIEEKYGKISCLCSSSN
jgi:hypothetical protein